MKTSIIKPGLLVSLKTSIRGGVDYQRIELEPEHTDDDGASVARWETLRHIPEPAEYERANAARGRARALVSSACCLSSFGLLCPSDQEEKLRAAIDEARSTAASFNAGAKLSQVEVYVIVGRVAQDEAEAMRSIAAELRELMEQMLQGIKAADPEAIREAANKARNLGGMLSQDAAERVSVAIVEARAAAREIVKRVEKSGEAAAAVVAELSFKRIEAARFAFLDLDEGTAIPEAPAAPGVDLDFTQQQAEPVAAISAAPQLDFTAGLGGD